MECPICYEIKKKFETICDRHGVCYECYLTLLKDDNTIKCPFCRVVVNVNEKKEKEEVIEQQSELRHIGTNRERKKQWWAEHLRQQEEIRNQPNEQHTTEVPIDPVTQYLRNGAEQQYRDNLLRSVGDDHIDGTTLILDENNHQELQELREDMGNQREYQQILQETRNQQENRNSVSSARRRWEEAERLFQNEEIRNQREEPKNQLYVHPKILLGLYLEREYDDYEIQYYPSYSGGDCEVFNKQREERKKRWAIVEKRCEKLKTKTDIKIFLEEFYNKRKQEANKNDHIDENININILFDNESQEVINNKFRMARKRNKKKQDEQTKKEQRQLKIIMRAEEIDREHREQCRRINTKRKKKNETLGGVMRNADGTYSIVKYKNQNKNKNNNKELSSRDEWMERLRENPSARRNYYN